MPSTRSPGTPYPTPLWASDGATDWRASGTEMAYSLFCTKKTTGAWKTAAKFIASWKSPSLVAPSPHIAITTVSSPLSRAACATPTACSSWVASGVACGATLCS